MVSGEKRNCEGGNLSDKTVAILLDIEGTTTPISFVKVKFNTLACLIVLVLFIKLSYLKMILMCILNLTCMRFRSLVSHFNTQLFIILSHILFKDIYKNTFSYHFLMSLPPVSVTFNRTKQI